MEEGRTGPTEKGKGRGMQKQETWEGRARDARCQVDGRRVRSTLECWARLGNREGTLLRIIEKEESMWYGF